MNPRLFKKLDLSVVIATPSRDYVIYCAIFTNLQCKSVPRWKVGKKLQGSATLGAFFAICSDPEGVKGLKSLRVCWLAH
tara:strand:+ start:1106 stop:1342 length:237 start_codon:yes stop_codon:yes gene_type:complete